MHRASAVLYYLWPVWLYYIFLYYLINVMKIRPLGAELFRADRETDRHDEANSRFSQFLQTCLKHSRASTPLPDCPASVICTGFPLPRLVGTAHFCKIQLSVILYSTPGSSTLQELRQLWIYFSSSPTCAI